MKKVFDAEGKKALEQLNHLNKSDNGLTVNEVVATLEESINTLQEQLENLSDKLALEEAREEMESAIIYYLNMGGWFEIIDSDGDIHSQVVNYNDFTKFVDYME